jgi:DNA (cytosine-5)-methyltransferase 1
VSALLHLPDPPETVNLFAGPGGWCVGARILGLPAPLGVDISPSAIATATAAGLPRLKADVRSLDPRAFAGTTGLVASPPCPTFSRGGLGTGLADDYQRLLDCITAFGEGCEEDWADLPSRVADPRTALAAEVARWALLMPDLEWLVAEQVPALEYCWEDIAAELSYAGWESFDVITVEAADMGLPTRRKRTFIYANRYYPTRIAAPYGPVADERTFADVLGWPAGHKVRTRNNRRPTGGNLFSADKVGWCLTEKARTWERDGDELRLTSAEAGQLNGFPRDYPWQGSRTSQFHQVADVVAPPVAAAVLGCATGIEWREPVAAYLDGIYEAAAASKAS